MYFIFLLYIYIKRLIKETFLNIIYLLSQLFDMSCNKNLTRGKRTMKSHRATIRTNRRNTENDNHCTVEYIIVRV